MTPADPDKYPMDDGSGAKDLRLAAIVLGVPAFVALALGIILSLD